MNNQNSEKWQWWKILLWAYSVVYVFFWLLIFAMMIFYPTNQSTSSDPIGTTVLGILFIPVLIFLLLEGIGHLKNNFSAHKTSPENMKKNKNMRWKIYFFIVLFINLIFTKDYLKIFPEWTFKDLFDFVFLIITVTGLYLFVFRKTIFNTNFWKIVFWVYLMDILLTLIYFFSPLKNNQLISALFKTNLYASADNTLNYSTYNDFVYLFCAVVITVILSFFIPHYYALYKLGYPKRNLKKLQRSN